MPRVLPESSRLRSSVPVRKRRRALRKATPIPEGGLRRFPNHPALLRLFDARFHFFVSVPPSSFRFLPPVRRFGRLLPAISCCFSFHLPLRVTHHEP